MRKKRLITAKSIARRMVMPPRRSIFAVSLSIAGDGKIVVPLCWSAIAMSVPDYRLSATSRAQHAAPRNGGRRRHHPYGRLTAAERRQTTHVFHLRLRPQPAHQQVADDDEDDQR